MILKLISTREFQGWQRKFGEGAVRENFDPFFHYKTSVTKMEILGQERKTEWRIGEENHGHMGEFS
jgi:hypothetical protein